MLPLGDFVLYCQKSSIWLLVFHNGYFIQYSINLGILYVRSELYMKKRLAPDLAVLELGRCGRLIAGEFTRQQASASRCHPAA